MRKYDILKRQIFSLKNFSLTPIRAEDRYLIMKWRNEQMFHLRQDKPLTIAEQDRYFDVVIKNIFQDKTPNQLLFSYLLDNVCIGYGGLVHIDWQNSNAEISFIMNTELEKEHFVEHWINYLKMIEEVAFDELNLHKIFTYAYDIRPKLYEALTLSNYLQEARLVQHTLIQNEFRDVLIHSKFNGSIVN